MLEEAATAPCFGLRQRMFTVVIRDWCKHDELHPGLHLLSILVQILTCVTRSSTEYWVRGGLDQCALIHQVTQTLVAHLVARTYSIQACSVCHLSLCQIRITHGLARTESYLQSLSDPPLFFVLNSNSL